MCDLKGLHVRREMREERGRNEEGFKKRGMRKWRARRERGKIKVMRGDKEGPMQRLPRKVREGKCNDSLNITSTCLFTLISFPFKHLLFSIHEFIEATHFSTLLACLKLWIRITTNHSNWMRLNLCFWNCLVWPCEIQFWGVNRSKGHWIHN